MDESRVRGAAPPGRVRWVMMTLVFFGVAINYLDRTNISVLVPTLEKTLHIGPALMGVALSAFFWAYVVMQMPSGLLLDRWGARLLFSVSMAWWSLVQVATSLVNGFGALLGIRVLLGIGESPAFNVSAGVIADWLPEQERGIGGGLVEAALNVGSAFAPPLVVLIALHWGWQATFVTTGILGLIWLLFWRHYYRKPEDHPTLSTAELQYIQQGRSQSPASAERVPFSTLLGSRGSWGLGLGYFADVYLSNIFFAWLPAYLIQQRHMSLLTTGYVASIPYLAGFVGALVGGRISDALIRRGMPSLRARKTLLVIGMLGGTVVIPAVLVGSAAWAVVLLSVANAFLYVSNGVFWATVVDLSPARAVGTVAGFVGFIGLIGAILAPLVTGLLVAATKSFVPPLVTGGLLCVLGALAFGFMTRPIRPAPRSPAEAPASL